MTCDIRFDVICRVDTVTLDTLERKNMTKCVALVNHTSHPHVMPNGKYIMNIFYIYCV